MARYITVPFDTDPETLIDEAVAYLQDKIDGWEPADGNLDYWIIQAISSEAAELMDVASAVPDAIYRVFGAELMNVPPIEETNASTFTTWTMVDTQGYLIPAGTQVGIRTVTDDIIPFLTQVDVTIPPGSSATAAGEILIVAIEPGVAATGLGIAGGAVELLDSLAFVSSIVQTLPTAGGVDAEADDAYLDRLTAKLKTMTPRPILPNDFSILARDIAGVYRATTIDGYNPVGGTYNNERMVAVAAMDSAGSNISSTVKTALQNYLDSMREINFVVNVIDPNRTNITVTFSVAVLTGFDVAVTIAAAAQAVTDFLHPLRWGADPVIGDPLAWEETTVIRYNEIVAVLDRVEGVKYVSAVTVNGGVVNVNLTAPAALPNLTSVTGTAV